MGKLFSCSIYLVSANQEVRVVCIFHQSIRSMHWMQIRSLNDEGKQVHHRALDHTVIDYYKLRHGTLVICSATSVGKVVSSCRYDLEGQLRQAFASVNLHLGIY